MNESEIFADVLKLASPSERAHFLDAVCSGNATLRAEVEKLLQAHSTNPNFLEQPVADFGGTIEELRAEQPGAVIGPYKLLEQIGEGGMGTVWMAQQTEPVKRVVAVKLIKAGMDSKQVIARFEAERQALALMDHPNIAKVLDGGTTSAGRPYFVMDLVKGVPITRYCDEHHLTPRQRLELFIPVCQAIQHAHQKGIIHRDIKPSNVLVALYDGKPVPKVIDFGVAKAAGQSLTDKTLVTGFGAIVGTLEYMSPEQAEVNQLDIDTRSDIYSLGVLLYELLAGSPPFSRKDLEKAGMLEMLRVIREQEPSKPSTKLSSSLALPTLSANRGTEPKRLTKLVRGELDWIVMKALEKDRSRRYETANGFAMDVQRYLADEAVQACPPSPGYRLRKFVRRNRWGLAVAAALGLALLVVVGAVAGSVGWAARDRAAQRARVEVVVGESLAEAERLQKQRRWSEASAAARRAEGLFRDGDGLDELRRQVESRRADLEMVERLEDIRLQTTAVQGGGFATELADANYVRAFREFGIDVEALSAEEAAAQVRARSVSRELAAALDYWAISSSWARGKDSTAWRHFLAVARAADPDPERNRLRAVQGRSDRAELVRLAKLAATAVPEWSPSSLALLGDQLAGAGGGLEAVELLRVAQRRNPGDFYLNHELGAALMALDPPRPEEALRFYAAALAIRPRSPGAHVNLGTALVQLGKHDEAAAANRFAIELKPDYAQAYYNLGIDLYGKGKLAAAIDCYRTAVRLDPSDPDFHHNLGRALADQGEWDEAIDAFGALVRLQPSNPDAHFSFGHTVSRKGRVDEAIAAYRTALQLKPDHARALCNLGLLQQREKKQFTEALRLLRRGHELGSREPGWKFQSADWVKECENLVRLDARLTAVQDGKEKVSGKDAVALGQFAHLERRSIVAAARLYAAGLADRPDLAGDIGWYNPACASARAGTETHGEPGQPDGAERARFRKQALTWLHAELADYVRLLESGKPEDYAEIKKRLLHWQGDADLASLRDAVALEKLPAPERQECRLLWAEVAQVLAKTDNPKK